MTCHENGKWCNLGPVRMGSQVLSHVDHLRLMRAKNIIKACLLCTQTLERFVVAHTTRPLEHTNKTKCSPPHPFWVSFCLFFFFFLPMTCHELCINGFDAEMSPQKDHGEIMALSK